MNAGCTRKKIENFSYGLNDVIGKGYSSHVFKGRNDDTSDSVAIKVIDLRLLKNDINRILLNSQIEVLKQLKSLPHILALHQVFTTKNNTYIITELCESDLNKIIKKKLTETQACAFMQQVLKGYLNFARKQIVHRDLKPANILITEDQQLKIADFGFAIKLQDAPKSNKYNVGSPLYMAPQSLKRNEYTLKSDIWALGIIFFEMLTGETPWKAKNEKQLVRKIQTEKIEQFLIKMKISETSKQFLRRTLKVDKNQRMSMQQLGQFYFDEVKTSNILTQKKSNFDTRSNYHNTTASNYQNNFSSNYHNNSTFTPKKEVSVDLRMHTDKSCENNAPSREYSKNKFNSFKNDKSDDINRSIQLKPTLNSKYNAADFKQRESSKSTKQNPQAEMVPKVQLINKMQNRNQKKLISKILVCEIHFCRFLYKLLTKIIQSSKKGLLQHSKMQVDNIVRDYMGIIKHKIENIINFDTENFIKVSSYEQYRQSSDFQKLIKIAKQYKGRYSLQLKNYWTTAECSFSTDNTIDLISHLEKLLHLKEYEEGFISNHTRQIIILDYLITSKQLIDLCKHGQNYERFAKKSKIEDIVQGKTAQISQQLYTRIVTRAKQLIGPTLTTLETLYQHEQMLCKA